MKTFENSVYTVLIILVLLFYTKDINIFNNNFYKNINKIEDQNDILVLVNKNNVLDENYIPNDLEKVDEAFSSSNLLLRKEAKVNFEKLCKDALKYNYHIKAVSTYRSYKYQDSLFKNYVNKLGLDYAIFASAMAGHSEHQTGLAIDVEGSNLDYNKFGDSKEINWMIENAHKYGFILRYDKGKEHITGFKYEPWHYRYVGNIASYIYNNNLTLEEYKNVFH